MALADVVSGRQPMTPIPYLLDGRQGSAKTALQFRVGRSAVSWDRAMGVRRICRIAGYYSIGPPRAVKEALSPGRQLPAAGRPAGIPASSLTASVPVKDTRYLLFRDCRLCQFTRWRLLFSRQPRHLPLDKRFT